MLLLLQVLTLNDCDLNSIPDSVSRLTTLKVLEVANNGLMDVPETLSKLTNLECLNLEGNCFPKLPEVQLTIWNHMREMPMCVAPSMRLSMHSQTLTLYTTFCIMQPVPKHSRTNEGPTSML